MFQEGSQILPGQGLRAQYQITRFRYDNVRNISNAMMAADISATGVMASVWWLVLAYFILEVAEMCLSPIGLSAVSQLSVPRVVGVMMGAFWLATAYSEVLAAGFGKLASIDIPEGSAIDMAAAAGKYGSLLGENKINIARMEVSRIDGRGDALVLLTLDDPVPPTVFDQIVATVKPTKAYRISI